MKALPIAVYRHILLNAHSIADKARAHLLCGALFFAMRSCEYTRTPSHAEKRTITIRVRDVGFYKKRRKLHHADLLLHLADSVAITFHLQKRSGEVGETIVMHRTRDPNLNPVAHWAHTIRRIITIPKWNPDWPVNTIHRNGKIHHITNTEISKLIKTAVTEIGVDILGFTKDDVNTHSNRAAAAMAMYLANVPVYTIMLVGRWSSDAFLLYIRKQVQEFTKGISGKMLLTPDYYTVPDNGSSNEDPRIHNNNTTFGPANYGPGAGGNVLRASFALCH